MAPPRSIDGAVQHSVAQLPATYRRHLGRLDPRPRLGPHRCLQRGRPFSGGEHRQARDPARRALTGRFRSLALVVVVARARARARLVQPRGQRAVAASRRRDGGRRAGARTRRHRHVHLLRLSARAGRELALGAAHAPAAAATHDGRESAELPVLQVHDRARSRHAARLARARLDRPRARAPAGDHRARGARRPVAARARELCGARAALLTVPGRPQGGLAARRCSTTRPSCSRRTARSSPSS